MRPLGSPNVPGVGLFVACRRFGLDLVVARQGGALKVRRHPTLAIRGLAWNQRAFSHPSLKLDYKMVGG